MRTIKFRIWDGEQMIYPSELHNEQYVLQLNCSYVGKFNGKAYDHINPDLMQFTRLHDKNGREVYEGDVVEIFSLSNGSGHRFPHVIEVQGCDYVLTCKPLNQSWGRLGRVAELNWSIEVIGNIHENPELL